MFNGLVRSSIGSSRHLLFRPQYSLLSHRLPRIASTSPVSRACSPLQTSIRPSTTITSPSSQQSQPTNSDDLPLSSFSCSSRGPAPQTASSLLLDVLVLGKHSIAALVMCTAAGSYVLTGAPIDYVGMAGTVVGVGLQSFSAGAVNHMMEIKYDANMRRTQNRPLVCGRISVPSAAAFSATCGLLGGGLLYSLATPPALILSSLNIALYASYTKLKRVSTWNTAFGAIVGAIPPVVGWTAAGGDIFAGTSAMMASILFLWQFPHFYSLAWKFREDYTRAGYQMLSVFDPTGKQTYWSMLRPALLLCAVPGLAAYADIIDPEWAAACTAVFAFFAYKVAQFDGSKGPQAFLPPFKASIYVLPLSIILLTLAVWTKEIKEGDVDPVPAEMRRIARDPETWRGRANLELDKVINPILAALRLDGRTFPVKSQQEASSSQ